MWFETKNDLTFGVVWHQKNALIANHFRFPELVQLWGRTRNLGWISEFGSVAIWVAALENQHLFTNKLNPFSL